MEQTTRNFENFESFQDTANLKQLVKKSRKVLEIFCNIPCCSRPENHNKEAHECRACGCFGHSPAQCGNLKLLAELSKLEVIPLNQKDYCTWKNCANPHTHMLEAHKCEKCRGYHKESDNCPFGCKVFRCRYAENHTTSHHGPCAKCENFGHSEFECKNQEKLAYLEQFRSDVFPIEQSCSVCYSRFHKTAGHMCSYCKKFHGANCKLEFNDSSLIPFIADVVPVSYAGYLNAQLVSKVLKTLAGITVPSYTVMQVESYYFVFTRNYSTAKLMVYGFRIRSENMSSVTKGYVEIK